MSQRTFRGSTVTAAPRTAAKGAAAHESDHSRKYYVYYQLWNGTFGETVVHDRYRTIRDQMEAIGAVAWQHEPVE